MLLDISDMPIALPKTIELVGPYPLRTGRGRDHLGKWKTLSSLYQQVVGWLTAVGTVSQKHIDPAIYPIQEIGQCRRIVPVSACDGHSHDMARAGLEGQVKLQPAPALAGL